MARASAAAGCLALALLLAACAGANRSKASPTVTWVCAGDEANEIVATYYQTDPPSLVVTRGADRKVLRATPSASGSRYEGDGALLWEHQGTARIAWGAGAPEEDCARKR